MISRLGGTTLDTPIMVKMYCDMGNSGRKEFERRLSADPPRRPAREGRRGTSVMALVIRAIILESACRRHFHWP
jgi:hypothetical protein